MSTFWRRGDVILRGVDSIKGGDDATKCCCPGGTPAADIIWSSIYDITGSSAYKFANCSKTIPAYELSSSNQQSYDICFDGTNMWLAGYYKNCLSKVAPNGTITNYQNPYPVDQDFEGGLFNETNFAPHICYAAGYIWLTGEYPVSGASHCVAKMSTTTGKRLDRCILPDIEATTGIAFDGTYVWVLGHGRPSQQSIVVVFDPNDAGPGITYKTSKNLGINADPHGLAWDGTHMWICFAPDGGGINGSVGKYSFNGVDTVTEVFKEDTGYGQAYDICWDGNNMWVCHYSSAYTHTLKLDSTGTAIMDADYTASDFRAIELAWNGTYLYMLGDNDGSIKKININTGVVTDCVAASVGYSTSLASEHVLPWPT
jgi:hypothetical protein